MLSVLEVGSIYKLFGILLYRRFTYYIQFGYLVCTHLFSTLVYDPILFYFVFQITLILATGSSFSRLLCSCDIALSILNCRFYPSMSLLFDTTRCSKFISYIFCPSLKISHFSRESRFLSFFLFFFFLFEYGIGNQDFKKIIYFLAALGLHC